MKNDFIKDLLNIIEIYRNLLNDDNYIKNILVAKFPKATEKQINNKITNHRNKINKQLDRLIEVSKNFTDYDINKYKNMFDPKYNMDIRIKNLLFLKNTHVGI